MQVREVLSNDGVLLKCAISNYNHENPCILLILPFGLRLEISKPFFDFFGHHYNVITWEARSILESCSRPIRDGEFSMENHISDFITILEAFQIRKTKLVGYCSGAGVSLAIANHYPKFIDNLVLVHGEYAFMDDSDCTTQFANEIDSLLTQASSSEEKLNLIFEKISNERLNEIDQRPEGIDMPFTKLEYLRRYSANYMEYKFVDFKSLARNITNKVFIMSGSLDVQTNILSSMKIKELIPNSVIDIDPRADHYGLLRKNSKTLIKIWNYLCE